jgi:hypothetical protein
MAPKVPPVSRQDRVWHECRLSANCTCDIHTTGETITTQTVESRFLFLTVKWMRGEKHVCRVNLVVDWF